MRFFRWWAAPAVAVVGRRRRHPLRLRAVPGRCTSKSRSAGIRICSPPRAHASWKIWASPGLHAAYQGSPSGLPLPARGHADSASRPSGRAAIAALPALDVIINRTLVYGALSATLAAVYFGGIVLLQRIFTGHEKLPQLAIVASTLAIAALFNPLRRRLQAFIDQRFYRRKYDARRTLELFGSRLRQETNLDTLGGDLVGLVRETLQPVHVSLWLREPSRTTKDDV